MMIKSMLEIDHYSPNQNFITSKKKIQKDQRKKKVYENYPHSTITWTSKPPYYMSHVNGSPLRAIVNKLL